MNDAPPRRPGGLARLIALFAVGAGFFAVLEVGFPPAARSRLPVLVLSLGLALMSAWNPSRGLIAFSALFPLAGLGDRLLGGADALAWPILLFGGFAAGWSFRFLYDFESLPDPTRLDGTLRSLSALWVAAALLSALRARTLWALVHGLGLRAVNVDGLPDSDAIRDAVLSLAALGAGAAYFFVLRRAGEAARRAALAAATWGVALSALAAVASRLGVGPGETSDYWRMTGRASGAATDPNALGLLCGMAAVVSLACVATREAARNGVAAREAARNGVAARDAARNGVASGGRRALALLAVPAAAGLFLSGSRSGIVVALVGAALLLVLPGIPARRRAGLLALVLAAVAAAVLVLPRRPGSALERLRRTADESLTVEDRSSSRTVLWDAALRMFRHDPVAGGGLGAFAWELPNLLRESGRSLPLRDNPGNAYLQALAETGMLGFALTLLFCLALAREGWLAGTRGEPLARGSGAACLAFLGALAAGSHWFAPDVALYFFLLAAVCARPRVSDPSPRAARLRLAIVAAYAVAASVALVETRSTDEAFRYRPGLGFHAKETGPGGPFWWTQRRFAIRVAAGRSMSLGLAHFTPEGRPVTLTAVSDGREVFEKELVPGQGIRLRLSAGAAPRVVRFTLSRAFVPKRLGLSRDRRQL